jgi:hypothetical protein
MGWFTVSKRDNLDRYYLLKIFGFGIFLHHIHHDEDEGVYHNHPWSGLSIIFGSYIEQYWNQKPKIRRWFNWIRATRHHRVTLFKPVWTLFIHGPRSNKWSVLNERGEVVDVEPWRGVGGRTSYSPEKTK